MINYTRRAGLWLGLFTSFCIGSASIAQELQPGKGLVVFYVDMACAMPGNVDVAILTPEKQWKKFGFAKFERAPWSSRPFSPAIAHLPTGNFAIFAVTCGAHMGSRMVMNYRSEFPLAQFRAEQGKVINAGTLKVFSVKDPNATFRSTPKFDVAVGPMPDDVYQKFRSENPGLAKVMITRQMIGRPRPTAPEKKN
jgi:hypothetical protein